VFHAISQIAGIVAGIAGILALVLCWVPVLGQALAAVAAIATAVKLIADIVLMMNDEGSWADIGWDVFALATFGAGRVLSTAAQSTSTAASAVGRLEAGRAAATSAASRAAQGLPTGSSASAIRELVGQGAAALSRPQAASIAQDAGGGFLRTIGRLDTWATLSPRAIWADVANARGVLNVAGVVNQFRVGAANVSGAWGNGGALVGALQGDAPLMNAAVAASEIHPSLINASSAAAQAVGSSNVALAASTGGFAVGGYDQVIGFQSTQTWLAGGAAPPAIVAPYQAVFAPAPSPAERLHLVP
jgi:hypothetical protein